MKTESVNPRFSGIDQWPIPVAIDVMWEGQLAAIAAVKSSVAAISTAVEAAASRLKKGGRLVYSGAGTSGRIAVQDGIELFPTFGWPNERLVFLLAGGMTALTQSAEGAEDDAESGRKAVAEAAIGPDDVVIGVAASGNTAYTLAVLEAASEKGALTIAVSNNPEGKILAHSDFPIAADTGSEVLAGSTRMKAGTAQKAILNLFSTAAMIQCGFVHQGLMVNMRIANVKLRDRGRRIIQQIANVDAETAANALDTADMKLPVGILVAMDVPLADARSLLDSHDGDLRSSIETLRGEMVNHAE